MRYKKIMSAVMCILIVLSFYGCSKSTSDNQTTSKAQTEKKELKIMYLTIWADALNKKFESICKEWGEENNVDVNISAINLPDLSTKIGLFVQGKEGADVAVFPSHLTIVYHNSLADVSKLVNEAETSLGRPYDIAQAMNTYRNKWVGVPLYAWSHVWVYRSDLMKAKNIDIPKTWAEAKMVVRALTDKSKNIYGLGIGLGKDDDAAMFFQALLWSFGGAVFDETGTKVVLDSPQTRQAVNWLLELYKEGVIPPGAVGWEGVTNNRNFVAGTIAITANAPTIYYAAKKEATDLKDKIEQSLYPEGPTGNRFCYATEFSIAYLNTTKKEKLISSLIKYIFQLGNYNELIAAGEGSVNPVYVGIDAMSLWGNDPILKPAFESLKFEQHVGYPGPVTPAAAAVFEERVLTDMFGRIINDNYSVDQAVSEATKRVYEILARFQ